MLSFTLRSGSRTEHLSVASQIPWLVMQLVMSTGPSIAGNYVERADLARLFCELIAAAGAVLCGHEALARELLEHFRHERRGDAVLFGNFVGAARVHIAMCREVFYGDQAVVGFFGQLKHQWLTLSPVKCDKNGPSWNTYPFRSRKSNRKGAFGLCKSLIASGL